MSQFFFHVCRGQNRIADLEGTDLPDVEAAKIEAIAETRALMTSDIGKGIDWSRTTWIEVTDDHGGYLFDVPFRDALRTVD